MVSATMPGDAFVAAAREIGGWLVGSAIRDGGQCTWIADDGAQATSLSGNFADGTAGVAWFLAQVGEAKVACEALRHSLCSGDCPPWVALTLGRLLDLPEAEQLALESPSRAQTHATTPGAPGMAGDAEALRDAAALFDLTGERKRLLAAAPAAHRLMRWVRDRAPDQRLVGGEELPREEVGLSRGASGVALALAAWAARSGSVEGREAANEAAQLERVWLDMEEGWHGVGSPAGMAGGAAGIALARLGLYRHQPEHWLLAEAGAAIELVRRWSAMGATGDTAADDTLINGAAGAIEALLVAHLVTGETVHLHAARRLGRRLLDAAAARGAYAGIGEYIIESRVGLMHGLAGIGLTMLRLHAPAATVGAWQPLVDAVRPTRSEP
jgi:lantibiotic modifying enzyme